MPVHSFASPTRRYKRRPPSALLLLPLLIQAAFAQAQPTVAVQQDLGGSESNEAYAISADGRVVAGETLREDVFSRFLPGISVWYGPGWRKEAVLFTSRAKALSADGSIVAGDNTFYE